MHGSIYEWSDLEKPLKNAIVEVNSTPVQYMVAAAGAYSFNLPPGDYLIRAKYYRNNVLEYVTEEDIQIDREGDFVHDLLLFPPTESEYEFLGDINLTGDIDIRNGDNINNINNKYIYFLLIMILLLIVFIIFYRMKREKTRAKEAITIEPRIQPDKIAQTSGEELPEDLSDMYDIIIKSGGRITQKELRKKMPYSEAKISLMITDMEERGLIKKIKKGRSNILIARIQK